MPPYKKIFLEIGDRVFQKFDNIRNVVRPARDVASASVYVFLDDYQSTIILTRLQNLVYKMYVGFVYKGTDSSTNLNIPYEVIGYVAGSVYHFLKNHPIRDIVREDRETMGMETYLLTFDPSLSATQKKEIEDRNFKKFADARGTGDMNCVPIVELEISGKAEVEGDTRRINIYKKYIDTALKKMNAKVSHVESSIVKGSPTLTYKFDPPVYIF